MTDRDYGNNQPFGGCWRRCVKPQRQQCKDNYVKAVVLGCGVDRGVAMAICVVMLTCKQWVMEVETHAGE